MKTLRLLVTLALLTSLTGCWRIGDYIYYESAYYTFVNETEHDVYVDCFDRKDMSSSVWSFSLSPGEEDTFYAPILYPGWTIFKRNMALNAIVVRSNGKTVFHSGEGCSRCLFSQSVYERRESTHGKADYECVFRFTPEFFEVKFPD